MKKAYLFAGTSILLWSTIATISKILLNTLSSLQVLCISSLFALVFLFAVNLFTGNFKRCAGYKARDLLIMPLIGLPGVFLYNLCLYGGTARMLASQAFIVNYLWPIMSVVFACILLKEKLTPKKCVAIVLSFLGVVIVTGGDLLSGFRADTLIGAAFCATGAVCYGIFTALNQKYHYDKCFSMMLTYGATFLLTLLLCALRRELFLPSPIQLLGLGWNGTFVMATATTSWALALESGKTAKISNLAYITPFLSLVWTRIFLKEEISAFSLLGLAVIILGIFIQLNDKKTQK